MSLFFKPAAGEQRDMTSWQDAGWSGSNSRSTNRATHLVPVFAALRHITDYASSLPVDSYWRNLDGTRSPAPLPQLLQREEGQMGYGIGAWFGQAAYAMAVDGNAVGWVSDVDGFGRPTRVHWLAREEWSFAEITRQWYVFGAPVPRSRICHIPWIVPNGKTLGLSPIEHYAATIGAGLSAQEYADVKRGGGLPPTVLKNDAQTIDKDQADRISRVLAQKFATGRPFVHGKDWTFGTVSIPPNHAQFIETLKLTANQVASIYGLNPTDVGGEAGNKQEYTNPEGREIDRAERMRPYLTRLEDAVSRWQSGRTFVKFNIDARLRVDTKTRVEVLGLEIADGRKSVDEARALDDLPPVPGGDFHNVPVPAPAPVKKEGAPS